MNLRDIIDALRESPFWEMLSPGERVDVMLQSAELLDSRKMINILKLITSV